MDAHKNFATSLVATAPSPATSGTSLVVTSSEGTRFPAVPFNATIGPDNTKLTPANSEIVRVTAISTDTFTIVRAQEGTSARTVVVGDVIFAGITAKTVTDVEHAVPTVRVTADDQPASPSAYDDEFNDASIDGKWSWRNQGSNAEIEEGYNGAIVTATGATGPDLKGREQTAPAGDFTVILKSEMHHWPISFMGCGLYVANNSNGKLLCCGRVADNGPNMYATSTRRTNATTFNANITLTSGAPVATVMWFKIVVTGTNVTFFWSGDGNHYHQLGGNEAIATFLGSVRGDLDRVGFYAIVQNANVGVQHIARYFRIT